MTAEGAKLFEERSQRILDAVELREPDRVPFSTHWHFWPARYAGMTCREAMYEHARFDAAVRKAVLDLEPDSFALMQPGVALGPAFDEMGFRMLEWPGHGVGEDSSYQYIDREYMTADEYDDYILDPTGFFLRKYLPRVAEAFEGFAGFPDFPAFPYLGIAHSTSAFATPEMAQSFERLAAAGQKINEVFGSALPMALEMTEHGFPTVFGSFSMAPYDYIADYMRGSRGAMLDMFRHEEKMIAAIDKARAVIVRGTIERGASLPSKTVFIPLHWGLDGFMSGEQFEKFYWPSLRDLMVELIDAGMTPLILWEGDCESRLEVIGEIPAGKAIYFFERTDPFKAKAVLGDTVCLRGFVPASLLTTGKPSQVEDYCKRLIDGCAPGGGLIVDGSIGIPDDARVENVFAMRDAVWKYGQAR
ncbi:MAG: hypothetical protein CL910_13905 [Deltaproteobacteria bacterium]|nr:hypothetical protein [Deltaproteobacteria bacterium]